MREALRLVDVDPALVNMVVPAELDDPVVAADAVMVVPRHTWRWSPGWNPPAMESR